MASQTQGIQQLLTAEKRAAEKVSEARKRKNRRLKQAKEEAQAEIEKYKAERETIFKGNESKFAGSKGDVAAQIDADAKARIGDKDVDEVSELSERQSVASSIDFSSASSTASENDLEHTEYSVTPLIRSSRSIRYDFK